MASPNSSPQISLSFFSPNISFYYSPYLLILSISPSTLLQQTLTPHYLHTAHCHNPRESPVVFSLVVVVAAVVVAVDENPLLILTHGDMLSTKERIEGCLKICEWSDISETIGVHDTVCLIQYGYLAEESDPVTAYALFEAVYRALLISDRGHCPKKNIWDWTVLILSWLMCFFGTFVAFLSDLCSKLGQMDKLEYL